MSEIKGLDRAQAAYDRMVPDDKELCGGCDLDEIEALGEEPADYPLCNGCLRRERDAYREDMADERRKYGD